MKIKVLIVEDETLIAQEISACLEENDFEVTGIASTSDEALRLIKDNKPDVILMDIMIKGKVNGIELSKKILENEHSDHILNIKCRDTLSKKRPR